MFSEIMRSETARTSLFVVSGNVFLSGLGFVLLLILTRKLGPENYGVFAIAMAVAGVLVGLTDLGLGAAIVRFVNKYKASNPGYALSLVSSILRIELILTVGIVICGIVFSQTLVNLIWHDQRYLIPIRWAFVIGAILSLASYNSAVLQAFQRFLSLFLTNLSGSVARVVLVLLLLALSQLNETTALATYALASSLILLVGFYFIKKKIKGLDLSFRKEPLEEVFHFSKWIFVSFLINSIAGKADIFLLSTMKGATEVGYYSAAFQLSSAFPVILGALNLVLLPKVSSFTDNLRFRQFFKKTVLSSVLLGVGFLAILPFSEPLIRIIFGQRYINSVAPFQILYIGFLIALVITSISTILYAKEKTFVPAVVNMIQLAVVISLNLMLIPKFGGTGSALAFLASTAFGGLVILVYTIRLIYKENQDG